MNFLNKLLYLYRNQTNINNMIVTTSWIEKNYNKFNNLYWNGLLPNIKFKTSRAKHTWGCAYYRYDFANDTIIPTMITVSNYYDSDEVVKIQTLLHEMIHIADYTFHPEHYIRNHRKVTAREYDAHGYYFRGEAARLSRESGYKITNHVTKEEMGMSKLSDNSVRCIENKKNNALVCVIRGTNGMNFLFKTDIYKVKNLHKELPHYIFYGIGEFRSAKFYTFEDEKLAAKRSCYRNIRGRYMNNIELMNKLQSIKATEYIF